MHVLLVASILLARTIIRAPSDGLPSGTETPRATDLLRAKRMADEASRRLQASPPRRGGWVRGGEGWERGTGSPDLKRDTDAEETELPTRRRVR
jgi:hypothetical protein